ncbi:hypothetical protein COY06_05425 [Candidatus Peregrinibacteria bacterium CG_4_10_14_0_2_um_filter_41_8]|nr:MAG: hypothetical protein COY06_05425 [Candidatus Peregrinibacteria bacterium CG_4_10_14_0_2_um_filter_41_8]
MRKFLIIGLFLTSLFTFGCSGGSTQVTQTDLPASSYDTYAISNYQIQYPIGWKVKRDFTSNIEKSTDVAFISNVKEIFFTSTATVAVQQISDGVLVKDFAQGIIDQNEKTLLNYEVIDRQELAIGETDSTFLIQFRGKLRPEDNLIEYFQTYRTKGNTGYVVTGAHDPNGDPVLATRLLEAVSSFRIR